MRKSVFTAVGGFATDRNTAESWQFLLRLNFKGFRQILIPESLYQHALTATKSSQPDDEMRATRVIAETYREGMSGWPARLIEDYVFGPYLRSLVENPSPAKAGRVLMPQDSHKSFGRKLQKSFTKRLTELAGFVSRL